MTKFLFLIAEAIFFLIFSLLFYYAPESAYFWNDGLGGSILSIYNNIEDMFFLSTLLLILFNILIMGISRRNLIKETETDKWLASIVYIEFMGIIAMMPLAFGHSAYNGNIPSILFIALLSAVFSLILLGVLKTTINPKTRSSFIISFIIASFILVLFSIFEALPGLG